MPVAELLARTGSHELSEWMAFDNIEPLGDRRLDVLAAMVMALIANVNRNAKKRKTPFKVEDFIPQWDKVEPDANDTRMLRIVEMLNAAHGGRDLRPEYARNQNKVE